ncbi:MAG: FAD-dependent oxidoreductase, partial [Shewanella sp.]
MSSYDIAIIGGGISGVGIAQYAAAAGYSTLLIEKGEIGGQTSANSSKLIHGGLRYLESGQINLVRKSLLERRNLLDLAPSLVKPVPFYIPVYQDSQRNPLTIRAGLSLYALLSEFDPLGRFVSIPAVHWHRFKGLKLSGLKAVFQYWDAQTDDKLLTQAVARSAQALGAHIYVEAEFLQLNHLKEHIELS